MEIQKPKIAFYVRRTFGEKMNACMDFIKENWKPLLKYSTYLVLPVALIQALSLNSIMGSMFMLGAMEGSGNYDSLNNSFVISFFLNYGLILITTMIGTLLLTSIVYTLIKLYNSREDRLNNITFAEIKPLLLRNVGKLLILMLFTTALVLIAMVFLILLAVLTPFTLFLTIPAFIIFVIPLMLYTPIYLMEDIGIIDALVKTFKLGFATYGGILAVMIVAGLVASIVQGATSTPWAVVFFVKTIFAYSESGSLAGSSSFLLTFVMYLLGALYIYGMYISMIITQVGAAYQYSHASELVDSVSVESDIDKFENL